MNTLNIVHVEEPLGDYVYHVEKRDAQIECYRTLCDGSQPEGRERLRPHELPTPFLVNEFNQLSPSHRTMTLVAS